MALITVSDVEAYLGVTLDSDDSAVYSDIIDAVSEYIECNTEQDFTDAVYAQRIHIIDSNFIINKNVQYLFGAYYGRKNVIKLICPDTSSSVNIDLVNKEIKVISELSTVSTIDISTITISALNTTLDALSGFTSTIEDNVDSDLLALTVFEASYGAEPDDSDTIYLIAANEPLNCSKVSNGLYQCPVTCDEGIAVYQGGYATIPADLKDLTIRMSIKAFDTRNAAVSGDLKREKIGDYEYEVMSAAESEGASGVTINYQEVLDCYRKLDI
jgi:hypothetical protein